MPANFDLPFDMFQRYMLTREIVQVVRHKRKMSVLDVGGAPGVISDFFPADDTYITDLKVCSKPNFVRADCRFLPFRSNAFDVVSNLDVMEHVPRRQRAGALDELVRVSRRFLVVGGPFNSEAARTADRTLHDYVTKVLRRHDQNLAEHVTNGLPSLRELQNYLNSKKLIHAQFSNGYLAHWLPMQILNFRVSNEQAYHRLNRLYNLMFYEDDNREPSYRKIVLIDKLRRDSRELAGKIGRLKKREQLVYPPRKAELFEPIITAVMALEDRSRNLEDQTKLKDDHINNLEAKITHLEDQTKLKDDHINNLEAKITHLEDQTKPKDDELYAIESSLAWRLIKRYRKFNDKWFPPGTKRRGLVERCASAVRVTLDEGLSSLLHRAYHRHPRQPSIDEQYQLWLKNNQLTDRSLLEMQTEASRFSYKPKISIIMPVYNTDEKWLTSAIDSVMKQVYSNWELCIVDDSSTRARIRKTLDSYNEKDGRIRIKYLKENRGISGASNEALTMASGDFVGFLDHDDELTRDALFEVVKLLNQDQSLDLIYSDEDKMDLRGRRTEPFFKPGWSPDLLLSMNYVSHFTVMRRSLIDEAGGFRMGFEGSQDYDLTLRATELTNRIAHIDKPLYSWRKVRGSAAVSVEAKPYARESAKKALQEALSRRGSKGEVLDGFGGFYHVKYAILDSPLVTIIIPTKDRVDLVKRCVESIDSKTSYGNYEIIIVDNNSTDPDTLAYLDTISHRVLKFNEPFNFSRINNFAARHAKGDHLVFLNNDTEIVEDCWLEAMLEHSQRCEVGMVGALLLYPTSRRTQVTVQHAGVILGLGGVANHAFARLQIDHPNYFGLHRVIRNCSAVTAACAMMRRSVFDEIGGFDEKLKVAFGDVDLGLRVREKGYRVVYAPNAMLYHHECATRGKLHPSEDETYMINKWKHVLARGDPYYSPNLTLLREDYSIAPKGSTIRPLAVLLEIYHLRPDLQSAYPEARSNDYQRLIDWAATSGLTADGARVPLRPYGCYYASHASDPTKPLATLVHLYNSRVELQRAYPEVLRGHYSGLIRWANQVLAGNRKGQEYSALKGYEAAYRSLMQSA